MKDILTDSFLYVLDTYVLRGLGASVTVAVKAHSPSFFLNSENM